MAVASVAEPYQILEASSPWNPGINLLYGVAACSHVVRNSTKAVFIQQRVNIFELLTGCEQRNFYSIYEANPSTLEKGTGYPLFFAQEDSGCLMRQICGPAREFNMDFFQRHPTEEKGRGPLLMRAHRPFKFCTTPCWQRPVIHVRDARGQLVGEAYQPFTCCDLKVTVRAPTEEGAVSPQLAADGKSTGDWFEISGSCCQPGLCCRCPCGVCKVITFEIRTPAGVAAGQVDHVWNGCCKSALTDADSYAVRFPAEATWYQKASIMAAVILLDFLFFERSNEEGSS